MNLIYKIEKTQIKLNKKFAEKNPIVALDLTEI